ncbi:MAG: hypothetical protein ACXVUX_21495 [Solirubrobacteraceae bacterium]
MTDLSPQLQELGDALHAATAVDVRPAVPPLPVRPRRRRIIAGLVVAVIAIPGVALAAGALISPSQVARSIPQGTLALLKTHPTCTVMTAGVVYDCTLASAPSDDGGPLAGQWLGTVEPTVDASQRVNGGCRSLNRAGTHWRCYVGRAAVRQQIIGAGFLGQHSSGPGEG